MQKTYFIFVFLFFFFLSVFGQKDIESKISDLEKKRFAAMTQKDSVFLQKVLANDLVYVHSNALIESKNDFLTSIKTGKIVYKSMESEEMRVRIFEKTAVINGVVKVNGFLNGKEFNIRLRYVDVYHKNKNGWQLETWQSLRLEN